MSKSLLHESLHAVSLAERFRLFKKFHIIPLLQQVRLTIQQEYMKILNTKTMGIL